MRARAVAALVVAAALLAVVLAACVDDDGDDGATGSAPSSAADAVAPFEGLTTTTVEVGGERLEVVVADETAERGQGLRDRTDPTPYDGMLFVYLDDTTTPFTMAGVEEPLAIAWFAADGTRVDEAALEPCLGDEGSSCPAYVSRRPYRYALETPPDAMPAGALRLDR